MIYRNAREFWALERSDLQGKLLLVVATAVLVLCPTAILLRLDVPRWIAYTVFATGIAAVSTVWLVVRMMDAFPELIPSGIAVQRPRKSPSPAAARRHREMVKVLTDLEEAAVLYEGTLREIVGPLSAGRLPDDDERITDRLRRAAELAVAVQHVLIPYPQLKALTILCAAVIAGPEYSARLLKALQEAARLGSLGQRVADVVWAVAVTASNSATRDAAAPAPQFDPAQEVTRLSEIAGEISAMRWTLDQLVAAARAAERDAYTSVAGKVSARG